MERKECDHERSFLDDIQDRRPPSEISSAEGFDAPSLLTERAACPAKNIIRTPTNSASRLLHASSSAQRTWLPDYHQRFSLRRQVEVSSAYEQEEELPIVTYPKRWDSIGFYSRRTNVASYAPAEFARLMYDLHKHGKALIFVKREQSLRDLLNALPDHLELEMLGREENYVAVGMVRPRKK